MIAPTKLLEIVEDASKRRLGVRLTITKTVFSETIDLLIDPSGLHEEETAQDETPAPPPPMPSVKDVKLTVPVMEITHSRDYV